MFIQDVNRKSYFLNTPTMGRTISKWGAVVA